MKLLKSIKRVLNQLLGLLPTRLPVGVADFQTYVDDLKTTYDLPTQDRDSIEFAVATMVMRLGPTTAYKSKYYFYISICAGCAKQIAGNAFHDIKVRQAAAQEAAKLAEVTATTQVISNGPPQQPTLTH